MSSLLQKDFYIITINCEFRLDTIDVDNLYKRKTFFMSIFIVFLINISFSFIVYNT